MKVVAVIVFGALLVFLLVQTYHFWQSWKYESAELNAAQAKVDAARQDVGKLQANLEYLSHPENLEKEVRARFNYRGVDESLLIIVPRSSSSTPVSSSSQ